MSEGTNLKPLLINLWNLAQKHGALDQDLLVRPKCGETLIESRHPLCVYHQKFYFAEFCTVGSHVMRSLLARQSGAMNTVVAWEVDQFVVLGYE